MNMLARDNKGSICKKGLIKQKTKCNLGIHDWQITKRVRVCRCCRKRQWRSIDSEGRYMDQKIKGIWVIRCTLRRMDDEPEQKYQFMTESAFQAAVTMYRVIRRWGAYQVEITWSPFH